MTQGRTKEEGEKKGHIKNEFHQKKLEKHKIEKKKNREMEHQSNPPLHGGSCRNPSTEENKKIQFFFFFFAPLFLDAPFLCC
jgi:hypothetical protein